MLSPRPQTRPRHPARRLSRTARSSPFRTPRLLPPPRLLPRRRPHPLRLPSRLTLVRLLPTYGKPRSPSPNVAGPRVETSPRVADLHSECYDLVFHDSW